MQGAARPHTVTMRLTNGDVAAYLYESRGGKLLRKVRGKSKEHALKLLHPSADDKSLLPGLVEAFQSSREFTKLAETTQRDYKRYLALFVDEFAHYDVKLFEDPRIKRSLTEWREKYADKPRKADLMIRAVGALFNWANDRGYTTAEPTRRIRMIHEADRADIIWTADDFARIEKVASPQLMNAIKLAAETGIRQGDLLRLKWSDVRQDHIQIVTRKRNRLAIIPLTSDALKVLDKLSRDTETVLVNRFGEPWTPSGLRASFQAARIKAKVDKRWHDLRGTAATRFRKMGFTNQEIATTMGWSVASVEQLMAKYVSGSELIRSAIQRVSENP